jgi:hypothetical protein
VRQRATQRPFQLGADRRGREQVARQGLRVQLVQRLRLLLTVGKVTVPAPAATRRAQALGPESVIAGHPAPDADLGYA